MGDAHPITTDEAGVYFAEFEGMLVANASCAQCGVLYLAWVDQRPRVRPCPFAAEWPHQRGLAFQDLSYRRTFNDEPSDDDVRDYVRWRERMRGSRVSIFDLRSRWW